MKSRVVAIAIVIATARVIAHAQESEPPVVETIEGESAGSALQRAVIERWARLSALRIRHGENHADVLRERAALREAIAGLRRSRVRVDRVAVARWIRERIAEVDARLGELSTSCSSGHPDVRTGQARRDALDEALTTIERRGMFVPTLAL
ncbi:hypothetical protein [Sandaracinus amylolyticus]|uniref:hypothetical protein n=1 Tax=Sandaracinus amylolyticus TaxID=927083 RepID=UPI001F3F57F0|nr:hypothetical protein [Sandaracinus amylolyticus]UJR86727.1 Hypothetical protein I5071_88280 [Sandaracinus amylolyticus]